MARRSPFKRRREPAVTLPWEQRALWIRGTLTGSRWRVALLLLAAIGAAGFLLSMSLHAVRMHDTRAAVGMVHRATTDFRRDHGRCPESLSELTSPPEGRRYLPKAPEDGWGQALFFQCPARFDDATADVVSAGPSGSFFENDNVR